MSSDSDSSDELYYGGPPSEADDARAEHPLLANFELFPRSYTPIAPFNLERARETFLEWMYRHAVTNKPCARQEITCSECGGTTGAFVLWTHVENSDAAPEDVVCKCMACHERVPYPLRQKLFAALVGSDLTGAWQAWWRWPNGSEFSSAFRGQISDANELYYELLDAILDAPEDPFTRMRDFLEARAANLIKRWLRFCLEEYSLRPGNAGAKKAEAHFYAVARASPRDAR